MLFRSGLIEVRDRIRARVVGRERELDLVLAAVAAGRDVVLEGPPGTSKSTLLRAITGEWGIPLVFVTASVQRAQIAEAERHGGTGVLPKPFTMAELRKRVAELLPTAG